MCSHRHVLPQVLTLQARQEALLGGAGFAAPPTYLVTSTVDDPEAEDVVNIFQLALEGTRVPLYSTVFRCMHCIRLRCTHAVL